MERYNGIIRRNIKLALCTNNLPIQQWEKVLPDALHSIQSLLSTATNTTPHDRFFNFPHRSSQGSSVPSWLTPGPVFLRRFVCSNKNDDLVDEVELTDVNPTYANIHYPDGCESTVSLKDLAHCPPASNNCEIVLPVEATESNVAIYSLLNNLLSHLL